MMKGLMSVLLLLSATLSLSAAVVIAATAVVDDELATLRKSSLDTQPELR